MRSSANGTQQRLGHTIGRNMISSLTGQLVLMLMMFFSVPYITRRLGPSLYGAVVILGTYIAVFNLLSLGINTGLVKFLAELLPQNNRREIQRYFGTALSCFLVVGFFVAAIASGGAGFVVRQWLNVPENLTQDVMHAWWIAGMVFLVQFLIQVSSAVAIAAQRFDLTSSINVGSEAVRTGGVVAVVALGHGLQAVMLATLLSSVLTCVTYLLIARRIVPGLSFFPRFSRTHFFSLFRYSKYVLAGNISSRIVDSADNMIIGYCLPVASLTYYGITYGLGQKLWLLAGNVASVVFPAASALSSTQDTPQLKQLYMRGVKMVAAVACFPALTLCLFSREFLLYWLGADFARHGTLVLSLLTAGFLLSCFGHVPYLVLQGATYEATAARFALAYATLNLTLFVLLIPTFGIAGAAVGFLGSQLVIMPWITDAANRRLGVGWADLAKRCYLPVLLSAAAGCSVSWGLKLWISSLFRLGLVAGAGFAVYVIVGTIIILDHTERRTFRELLATWLSPTSAREAHDSQSETHEPESDMLPIRSHTNR